MMLLSTSAFFFALGLAALASTTLTGLQSSIVDLNNQTFNGTATISTPMTAQPWPNETIGEYFDRMLSMNDTFLDRRRLRRSKRPMEVTWSESNINFNISMSRCLSTSDLAGIYTSKHGTRYNATIHDIINDLHVRKGSEVANRIEYASRVRENSQSAIDTANAYLKRTVMDFTTTDSNTHNELRHLLAPLGQYVALMARTTTLFQVMVGISTRVTNSTDDALISGPILAAVVASGVFFAQECMALAHGGRGISFLRATILNTFLAWFRDVMNTIETIYTYGLTPLSLDRSNHTMLDRVRWPISRTELEKAMSRLQDASEPNLRIGSQKELRAGASC